MAKEKCPPCDCPQGVPLWLGTYGDMVTLILTFFILLLSMASFMSLRGGRHEHGMSSFQALATAVAAQVGTGNIAGAATAIAAGGPVERIAIDAY